MRTPRRLAVVLSAVALSGALVACGDDDAAEPAPAGGVQSPGELPVPERSPEGLTGTDEVPTGEPGTTGGGTDATPLPS